jgi:low density lipoprotein-related protein 2
MLCSLLDGRYRRTVINSGLERPTSIAVWPERALVFWTDVGDSPRVEYSWMDGSHRRVLTNDRLGYPSGVTIDVLGQGRVYWADSKLNLIESSKPDGTDRRVVISGELWHPFSLDVFEDQVYWATRDTGEIFRQDKFGRGVKVRMRRSYATDVKVYHQLRYNTSVMNSCTAAHCSHLCLLIPGGHRCACPDLTTGHTPTLGAVCRQAAFEPELELPVRCQCRNSGACVLDGGKPVCKCPVNFEGNFCDEHVARRHIGARYGAPLVGQLLAPFLLLCIAMVLASGLYVYFKRRSVLSKSSTYGDGSVLFRNGAHVQFATGRGRGSSTNGSINDGDCSSIGEPIDGMFDMGDLKTGEFANPMYEAIRHNETNTAKEEQASAIYDLPDNFDAEKSSDALNSNKKSALGSAVLSLSSIIHRGTSGNSPFGRQAALNPSSIDTGKDTQQLVEEDKSEC